MNRRPHPRIVHVEVDFTGRMLLELYVHDDQLAIDSELIMPIATDSLDSLTFWEEPKNYDSKVINVASSIVKVEPVGIAPDVDIWVDTP